MWWESVSRFSRKSASLDDTVLTRADHVGACAFRHVRRGHWLTILAGEGRRRELGAVADRGGPIGTVFLRSCSLVLEKAAEGPVHCEVSRPFGEP